MKGKGNLSFCLEKRPRRSYRCISWQWKSRKNVLFLWFIHIFLRQSIWKVKGCKVLNFLGVWKGYHLSMEGIRKGYLFCQIWLDQVSPQTTPPPLPPPRKKAAASNQPVFLFRTLNMCFRKRNLVILNTTITLQFLGEYAISGHRCVMSRF